MIYYQQFPTQTANDVLSIHSSQHRPQMMCYQYTVPNSFYELKYDVTVYEQFFYYDLVPTMLPCMINSHTMFPAPTVNLISFVKIFVTSVLQVFLLSFRKVSISINLVSNFENPINTKLAKQKQT